MNSKWKECRYNLEQEGIWMHQRLIPVGSKFGEGGVGGCAIGTMYEEEEKSEEKEEKKKWMGKIGRLKTNPTFGENEQNVSLKERNLRIIEQDTIREKIAFDLYKIFSENHYVTPPNFLSPQLLEDGFNNNMDVRLEHNEQVIRLQFTEFVEECKEINVTKTLRIVTEWLKGFKDFSKAETLDKKGRKISFIGYMRKYRCPPKNLLNEDGKLLPLIGFMEFLGTARALSDTDCLGGELKNAGWIVETREDGPIARTVKIDPGESFRFLPDITGDDSVVNNFNALYYLNEMRETIQRNVISLLKDLNPRDIQVANHARNLSILWNHLDAEQQHDYHLHLKKIIDILLSSKENCYFCFYRNGSFNDVKIPEGNENRTVDGMPQQNAKKLAKQMKKWLIDQKKIYTDIKNHPESTLLRDIGKGALIGCIVECGSIAVFLLVNYMHPEENAEGAITEDDEGSFLELAEHSRNFGEALMIVALASFNFQKPICVAPIAGLTARYALTTLTYNTVKNSWPIVAGTSTAALILTATTAAGIGAKLLDGGAEVIRFVTSTTSASITSIAAVSFCAEVVFRYWSNEWPTTAMSVLHIAGGIIGGAAGATVGRAISKKWNLYTGFVNLIRGA